MTRQLKDPVCVVLDIEPSLKRDRVRPLFLAKTAPGMCKPDGFVTINHTNLRDALSTHQLEDLCGINKKNKCRLNQAGIFTALEFLDAEPSYLHRQVFGSIVGRYWSLMRLPYGSIIWVKTSMNRGTFSTTITALSAR